MTMFGWRPSTARRQRGLLRSPENRSDLTEALSAFSADVLCASLRFQIFGRKKPWTAKLAKKIRKGRKEESGHPSRSFTRGRRRRLQLVVELTQPSSFLSAKTATLAGLWRILSSPTSN